MALSFTTFHQPPPFTIHTPFAISFPASEEISRTAQRIVVYFLSPFGGKHFPSLPLVIEGASKHINTNRWTDTFKKSPSLSLVTWKELIHYFCQETRKKQNKRPWPYIRIRWVILHFVVLPRSSMSSFLLLISRRRPKMMSWWAEDSDACGGTHNTREYLRLAIQLQ